ncbi:dihydropteroate synthase [Candidatus Chlamydia sanziniae]|uniref:2-amino-4-hydroxy-6-hydroxymethyldihydropteridine pyrophosphokinase n=1 Tax=Candidatus Chlamydia sanziniae TaxID=1806891 RepID=A0A1A9HVX3_9CHLA|nr:dihydropteroate synthase [Candidatus Chlamydia sanziniae]ANH78561.1 2-amino-4-hydroxy-6- hydroxymethyldihydropteridine pyrophosphokinase [Candidatus Chlamydia sanziniae]
MSKSSFVCLGLGSNLGYRFKNLQQAHALLKEKGITELRSSVILETKALLLPESPKEWDLPFFNSVLVGRTILSPQELLVIIKQVEKAVGREESTLPWSPRVLDVDILLYGEEDFHYQNGQEYIPHRSLLDRPFLISLIASLCPYRKFCCPHSPYDTMTFAELAYHFPCPSGSILRSLLPSSLLMGIVNITDNSMSDGGQFLDPENAVTYAEQLFVQGAAIIDFGAQATNPGLQCLLSMEQEWARLEPVLKLLSERWSGNMQYPEISLDTFYPEIIARAMNIYPIHWINDVSGNPQKMAQLAKDFGLSLVMTHSCSIPADSRKILSFSNPSSQQILEWAEHQLEACVGLGLEVDQIIFDPGIGYGKSAMQSLTILNEVKKFQDLGCALLVGHSRKSFLLMLSSYDPKDRDWETVGISILLQKQGVDYLRVHNIEAHHRVLTAATCNGVPV